MRLKDWMFIVKIFLNRNHKMNEVLSVKCLCTSLWQSVFCICLFFGISERFGVFCYL